MPNLYESNGSVCEISIRRVLRRRFYQLLKVVISLVRYLQHQHAPAGLVDHQRSEVAGVFGAQQVKSSQVNTLYTNTK